MFERYTEKARRTIFFGRYEASQFGSTYIETEHLLLGLLREDKALAVRCLSSRNAADLIREQIEKHTVRREKVSTAVDLPLSHDCKLVLAYGAEEAEQLGHKHIGTEHLMLGLLRVETCFATQLLGEQGVTLDALRKELQFSQPQSVMHAHGSLARLQVWLAESEARGGISIVQSTRGANGAAQFAIYAVDPANHGEIGQETSGAEKLAQLHKRIAFIVERMENAIANHEFEKARFYSDEEKKERENLRLLREQFNLEDAQQPIPLLCIDVIHGELFTVVQQRCDEYIAEGVGQIWLLDPDLKRGYVVTKAEGLRECKEGILQMANPPLEMNLGKIF